MATPLRIALPASALAALLTAGCGPSDDRTYREPGETARAAPAATPVQTTPPDSTTGVARSSGRPGVAGDTVSRSSKISAPPGKTP